MLFVLVFVTGFVTVQAKSSLNKKVSKPFVLNQKGKNKAISFACGTAENGVWSSCWSATVSVTVCCDECDAVTATMLAIISAGDEAKKLIPLIALLNEQLPCAEV